jgi:hypothetical protein
VVELLFGIPADGKRGRAKADLPNQAAAKSKKVIERAHFTALTVLDIMLLFMLMLIP